MLLSNIGYRFIEKLRRKWQKVQAVWIQRGRERERERKNERRPWWLVASRNIKRAEISSPAASRNKTINRRKQLPRLAWLKMRLNDKWLLLDPSLCLPPGPFGTMTPLFNGSLFSFPLWIPAIVAQDCANCALDRFTPYARVSPYWILMHDPPYFPVKSFIAEKGDRFFRVSVLLQKLFWRCWINARLCIRNKLLGIYLSQTET